MIDVLDAAARAGVSPRVWRRMVQAGVIAPAHRALAGEGKGRRVRAFWTEEEVRKACAFVAGCARDSRGRLLWKCEIGHNKKK